MVRPASPAVPQRTPVRAYAPDRYTRRRPLVVRLVPVALLLLTAAGQIAWLVEQVRDTGAPGAAPGWAPPDWLVPATVTAMAATALVHALVHHGVAWTAGLLIVTAGGGLGAAVLNQRSGAPFGQLSYQPDHAFGGAVGGPGGGIGGAGGAIGGALTTSVAGVPLVVPLVWLALAYPAFVLARRVAIGPSVLAVPVVGALALTMSGVVVTPLAAHARFTRWADPTPALPGAPAVPLTAYAGLLLVSLVLMVAAELVLPDHHGPVGVPAASYALAWVVSTAAAALVLGQPILALIAGVGMGLVTVTSAWQAWNSRP